MSDPSFGIVVVEDEGHIRRFIRLALESEGFQVFEADGVRRGLIEAGTRCPDLVIVDLGLPDGDGVDLIRDLRSWSDVPVIVLSARSAEMDKVTALDSGADDYLTKPFGAAELLARVRAQLRRRNRDDRGATLAEFGTIRVDLAKRTVERNGTEIHLTPIEYRLLAYLIANPRSRADPSPAPEERLGRGACRRQPLRAHLHGLLAQEDRGRPGAPEAHSHRGGCWLPL
jgi:two-component system KDP operon response regulator KdpE